MSVEHVCRQLEQLKNVVVRIRLTCTIEDLRVLSVKTQGRLEPLVFPACVSHFTPTNCTLSTFTTGRVMATGTSSEHRAFVSALMLCDVINGVWPNKRARVASFRVVNRVAHVKLGIDIDMEKLTRYYKWSGLYEPKSFPGMKIEMIDLGVTFVVFEKLGKINIAGITKLSNLPHIAQRVLTLYEFTVPHTLPRPDIEAWTDDDDDDD